MERTMLISLTFVLVQVAVWNRLSPDRQVVLVDELFPTAEVIAFGSQLASCAARQLCHPVSNSEQTLQRYCIDEMHIGKLCIAC